ncbi:hypothetical protein EVAR_71130_1 [Eumeta japonica]|uniref:Uncharacterized protein n=1 Tax=Eumeta variegata TaxID=151549 RepID=A0A4C1ZQ84_EUMVA|nr:hypothetical protein EVAR_71130_1 [Eumeta japonica]
MDRGLDRGMDSGMDRGMDRGLDLVVYWIVLNSGGLRLLSSLLVSQIGRRRVLKINFSFFRLQVGRTAELSSWERSGQIGRSILPAHCRLESLSIAHSFYRRPEQEKGDLQQLCTYL